MNNILAFVPKMYFPGELYLGNKGLSYLKTIENNKKVFIVSKSFAVANKEVLEKLADDASVIYHDGEPTETDLKKLAEKVKKLSPEYLIAIGGGSVIDLAKAAKQELDCKLVVISTTLGSGAEVSQFALFSKENQKVILSGADLLPDVIIIDGSFLVSLDKEAIVFQAFDALSHALESLVSRSANAISDQFALMAITGLHDGLIEYLAAGPSIQLFEKMKISANLAGLAQSSAATGLAHSFAHYFGTTNHLPHAKAVTMFLLDVLEYNKASSDKYQKLNQLNGWTEDNFIERLSELLKKSEIKLGKVILTEDLAFAADKIRRDVCSITNPVPVKIEAVQKIIKKHL